MDSSKYAGYRKSRGENRASPGKQNGVVPTERAAGCGQRVAAEAVRKWEQRIRQQAVRASRGGCFAPL